MQLPFVERTLVLIKPDAVRRGLTGDIIGRFERAGLKIVALRMLRPALTFAKGHYPVTDVQLEQMGGKTLTTYNKLGLDPAATLGTGDAKEIGKMIHEWNAFFLSSGPVVAMVLEGVHSVKKVRSLCGKTMPIDAQPGTIRGDFASSSPAVANLLQSAVYNLIHASDDENDPEEPAKEIAYWFKKDDIVDYELASTAAMFQLQKT